MRNKIKGKDSHNGFEALARKYGYRNGKEAVQDIKAGFHALEQELDAAFGRCECSDVKPEDCYSVYYNPTVAPIIHSKCKKRINFGKYYRGWTQDEIREATMTLEDKALK